MKGEEKEMGNGKRYQWSRKTNSLTTYESAAF